jgi:cytoskeleton protein RodZ
MNSIGDTLRRERLRLNLDLEQISRETKISRKLLEAIEAEDFSRLPGGVFTKSFVRQYARVLGLDEDEIAAELDRTIQPEEYAEEISGRIHLEPAIDVPRVPDFGVKPRSGSSLPALAGMVLVMLICSGIYALWQQGRRTAAVFPQAEIAAPIEIPSPATPPGIQPAAVEAAAQQPPVEAAAPAAEVSGAERTGGSTASVRVGITATETTWISVRSDGRVVYSGTLEPNDTRNLDADEQIRIVVGNAGGLNLTLNGEPVPSLGPSGQVRVVQFSPGGFQIVPRNPAPPPDTL